MNWFARLFGGSRKPEARHAADVRARYTESLLATAGVVSVGTGQDADGKSVIVVGVSTAEEAEIVLPRSIEGVPVVVQAVGVIKAQE